MDGDELQDRRFTQDEVGELIENATRLDNLRHEGRGLSVDELRQVALELGISDESLLAAVHERMENERRRHEAEARSLDLARADDERRIARKKQLNDWKAGLASYIGVIAGLAVFDYFPDGQFDWVWWPAAGWGIGIAIHTFNVLFGVEDEE
jgi:hypothetical protein